MASARSTSPAAARELRAGRARVLVVDAEEETRVSLARALEARGHTAILASNGRTAVQLIRTALPELVLLEVRLPDRSGLALVESLRQDEKSRELPVIFVSSLTSEADRVRGLEAGAEDYVTKPFSVRELMLRVDIALRRAKTRAPRPLEAEQLFVDPSAHRVEVDGRAVELTPIEFALLSTLVGRAEQVQSREALLSDVWGASAKLATRTVDTHITRLRNKLGGLGDRIETVRGVGYRFRVRTELGA